MLQQQGEIVLSIKTAGFASPDHQLSFVTSRMGNQTNDGGVMLTCEAANSGIAVSRLRLIFRSPMACATGSQLFSNYY